MTVFSAARSSEPQKTGNVNAETLVCPERPEVEMKENHAKKTDSPPADSCKSCIHYHPTDSEDYEVYCDHFQKFYHFAKITCRTGYKRRG